MQPSRVKLESAILFLAVCFSLLLSAQTASGQDPTAPPPPADGDSVQAAVDLFIQCHFAQTGEPLPEGTAEWLREAFTDLAVVAEAGCEELAHSLDEAISEAPPTSEGVVADPDQLLLGQLALTPNLDGTLPDLGWADLCAVLEQGVELSGDDLATAEELDRVLQGQLNELTELPNGAPCDIPPEALDSCVQSLRQLFCEQGAETFTLTDDSVLFELEGCSSLSACDLEP